jgi:CTP-dependent riboflavin kinase
MARMTGVIFSDLGLASSFMSLDWVQRALRQSLGFAPFPATLNIRPKAAEDAETWRRIQTQFAGVPLTSSRDGFCSARLYPIEIFGEAGAGAKRIEAAILVPEVKDYPNDKIEIVASVRLKDHLGVRDGDALTLEFLN